MHLNILISASLIRFNILLVLFALFSVSACTEAGIQDQEQTESANLESEQNFRQTLEKHLQAVTDKDAAALRSTMSPEGKMQLILPGAEVMHSVDSFMQFHETWFEDSIWTFETEILSTEIGPKFGLAITQIIYREPERDGVPYFNRMIVSYGLEKIEDQWYIIKDHASSIEKSTDNQ